MATARRLKSGNYRCLVYAGKDKTGKRIYQSFTAPTKREAERMALNFRFNASAECTLKKAAEDFINSRSNLLSPSTIAGYSNIQRNYFGDIMHLELSCFTREKVQTIINNWSEKLSPKTVRNAYGHLRSILKFKIPDFNINILLPQKENKEFYIPPQKDIEIIYAHLKGGDMELPFLLASQLGLRASEVLAVLSDPQSHIKDNEIYIKDAIVRGQEMYIKKKPKTNAGYREIPCSDYIIQKIKNNNTVVLNISPRWNAVMKKIPVKYFNFHALRHYFASRALLLGIPQMYIAEMMGHSSTRMIERVYQHTFKDEKKEFQNRMLGETNGLIGN